MRAEVMSGLRPAGFCKVGVEETHRDKEVRVIKKERSWRSRPYKQWKLAEGKPADS